MPGLPLVAAFIGQPMLCKLLLLLQLFLNAAVEDCFSISLPPTIQMARGSLVLGCFIKGHLAARMLCHFYIYFMLVMI